VVEIGAGAPLRSAISTRGGSRGQRNKMRLLLHNSTALWRRGILERVALAVFGFPQRGEFPGEQVFAPAVFNRYAQHLRKPFFLLRRNSRDTQSPTWVLISCYLVHFISRRAKSNTARAKNCSLGNPPPKGNPGLKCNPVRTPF
jgi:hypothetical protein